MKKTQDGKTQDTRPGARKEAEVSSQRDAGQSISRMPRATRDKVSRALEDGADWKAVRDICSADGFPGIRPQNVTNYRKGAHQEWLRREERMEALRRDSEATQALMRHYTENGGSPAEAGLLAGAEMMCAALASLGPETYKSLLADDPKAAFQMMKELDRVAKLIQQKTQDRKTQDTRPEPSSEAITPEQRAAALKQIFGLPG